MRNIVPIYEPFDSRTVLGNGSSSSNRGFTITQSDASLVPHTPVHEKRLRAKAHSFDLDPRVVKEWGIVSGGEQWCCVVKIELPGKLGLFDSFFPKSENQELLWGMLKRGGNKQ